MKIKRWTILGTLCLAGLHFFFLNQLSGQDTIYLKNSSFEDIPRAGTPMTPPIKGWSDCGLTLFPGETPPDIHPVPTKAWNVSMQPHDGETYLGLVIRYNGTYESISQKLEKPLEANKCYSFTAFLARSDSYLSGTTRSKATLENFTNPAVLSIWGGNETCEGLELLGQSFPVDHSNWKHYDFILKPGKDYTYINIEVYFADPDKFAYNGHIMVDNLSPIIEIDCE